MGAGIFSLPYVFSQVGVVAGLLFLLFFAFIYVVAHSMYVEVLLTSPRPHDFFYAAEKYLPRALSRAASFTIVVGLLFSLLVYLVLAPTFVELLFGFSGIGVVVVFWIIGTLAMFLGVRGQSLAGLLGILVMAGLVLVVFGVGSGEEIATPALQPLTPVLFFLPFGPILFSLAARSSLSEVVSLWRASKRRRKKSFSLPFVLVLGSLVPVIVYAVFVFGILRLQPSPAPDAFTGLMVSGPLLQFLGALGLVAIWTSYFVIGRNVRDNLRFDLGISNIVAWAVPTSFPLLLYAFGFRSFLGAVGIAGGVFLSLEAMFVVWMWTRVTKIVRWRKLIIALTLVSVFFGALLYQVITMFSH